MFDRVRTSISCSVRNTDKSPVEVGVHQGSMHPQSTVHTSDLVMDFITNQVKDTPPWSMMFADDIVLCEKEREVESKLNDWRR